MRASSTQTQGVFKRNKAVNLREMRARQSGDDQSTSALANRKTAPVASPTPPAKARNRAFGEHCARAEEETASGSSTSPWLHSQRNIHSGMHNQLRRIPRRLGTRIHDAERVVRERVFCGSSPVSICSATSSSPPLGRVHLGAADLQFAGPVSRGGINPAGGELSSQLSDMVLILFCISDLSQGEAQKRIPGSGPRWSAAAPGTPAH